MKGGVALDNNQIAINYAIAKCLGCDKDVKTFAYEYDQYYKETIEQLNSKSKQSNARIINSPL